MTDADDAGLVGCLRVAAPILSNPDNDWGQILNQAADRIKAQRREIEELRRERGDKDFALRNGKSLAEDALTVVRQRLTEARVPTAAFIDDHVGNAIAQRDMAKAALAEALKVIAPFAEACPPLVRHDTNTSKTVVSISDLRAASAFAAKHGGRE